MITIDPPSSFSPQAPQPLNRPALSARALSGFVRRAQASVGLVGEVSLLLTDDARMRELNRGFRSKRKTTDVLSFPAPSIPGLPAGEQQAGDLAISVEVAERQAEAFGHTLAVELRVLILHGLLHLAGFDHEADAGEMQARELALRGELGLPSGLIERVSGADGVAPGNAGRRTAARMARPSARPTAGRPARRRIGA